MKFSPQLDWGDQRGFFLSVILGTVRLRVSLHFSGGIKGGSSRAYKISRGFAAEQGFQTLPESSRGVFSS